MAGVSDSASQAVREVQLLGKVWVRAQPELQRLRGIDAPPPRDPDGVQDAALVQKRGQEEGSAAGRVPARHQTGTCKEVSAGKTWMCSSTASCMEMQDCDTRHSRPWQEQQRIPGNTSQAACASASSWAHPGPGKKIKGV